MRAVYQKVAHTELLSRLHSVEFDILDSRIRQDVQLILQEKYISSTGAVSLRTLENI